MLSLRICILDDHGSFSKKWNVYLDSMAENRITVCNDTVFKGSMIKKAYLSKLFNYTMLYINRK